MPPEKKCLSNLLLICFTSSASSIKFGIHCVIRVNAVSTSRGNDTCNDRLP
uniref:Uncharacterized protein n=1 Tax=Parascaris equorum TaxID=6256 RepID=A0A914S5X7_PAREQ